MASLKGFTLVGILVLMLSAPATFADEAKASSVPSGMGREKTSTTGTGPRDIAKPYSTSVWELMQRQANWTPSGPRDMTRVSSLSIWELMQKTAKPAGPRDEARVSSLSIWELMQKTAKPTGPRDAARASSVPSGGVGK